MSRQRNSPLHIHINIYIYIYICISIYIKRKSEAGDSTGDTLNICAHLYMHYFKLETAVSSERLKIFSKFLQILEFQTERHFFLFSERS